MTSPSAIDDYLTGLSPRQRTALSKLRRDIRAVTKDAEECISYRLAAFRLDGMLVAFGATAAHCAFYLMSDTTIAAHRDVLGGYDTSKGTIRFPPERPLPSKLVRMLVKARIAENRARRASAGTRARAAPKNAEAVADRWPW